MSRHETRVAAGEILRRALRGRAPTPGPSLVVVEGAGPGSGTRAALRDGLTIGRARGSGLRVLAPEVSRVHARVAASEAGFTICDAGSKNGVAVNGRLAREALPLRPGDVVTLGGARLRVEGEDPCAAQREGAAPARPPSPGFARSRDAVRAVAASGAFRAAAVALLLAIAALLVSAAA